MLFSLIKTFFVFVFYNTMQKQVVTKMNYKPPRLLMCDKKKVFYGTMLRAQISLMEFLKNAEAVLYLCVGCPL